MLKIKTNDLYEAAFYLTYGAILDRTDGTYPNVVFTLNIKRWRKIIADLLGIVLWKEFRKKRRLLKNFAADGKKMTFTMADVARIKLWSNK